MFLGDTQDLQCLSHGEASANPADQCCPGYNKWVYDANTGTSYSGFMCWSATCASVGQWAGPNGVGDHCCDPLVNVGGKCGTATTGGAGGSTTPLCVGTLICSVPDMYLYIGGGLLVLLMVMGKKKGA